MESRQATTPTRKNDAWWLAVAQSLMPAIIFLCLNPAPPNKAALLRLAIAVISTTNILGLISGALLYRRFKRRYAVPVGFYLRTWLLAALIVDGMIALVLGLIAQGFSTVSAYLIAITIFWVGAFLFLKWVRLQRRKLLPAGQPIPPGGSEAP